MRIVVLDGQTLNPGDLSWDPLQKLGDLQVYERTQANEIVELATGAQALLTNKAPLTRATLEALPDLKYIGVTATGYNIVDADACKELGITLCNVPAYSTASVAQLVFAFVLEHCHHVGLHSQCVRAGKWSESKDFAFWERPLVELEGLSFAIVGFGNIGQRVANIARTFGMNVLVHSRTKREAEGITWVTRENLFAQSDFLSLHCPLTPETEGMVNRDTIALMKPTAFLINTGRGGLIVEQDLADALNQDRIAGAGLDVLSAEPPPSSNPLLTAKNCFVTPHIAWATEAARQRLMDETVANLAAWQSGNPKNVIV